MNKLSILLAVTVLAAGVASGAGAADEAPALFGPVKYDVKERYGKPNQYTATFTASEGRHLLKLQNGEKLTERSEWIELTVNGEKVLPDGKYGYRFFGGFLDLHKENTLVVVVKDEKPAGFRRPTLPPRFVTITVIPAPPGLKQLKGMFGLNTWESLEKYGDAILKIKEPGARSLALAAASLQNDTAARADAIRKLSDLKDASAQEYLLAMYTDLNCVQDVRGEAALALGVLGDKAVIPMLMPGIFDPEDKVSTGSARALSFFREEDTQELLQKSLERLDAMRRDAVINAIVSAGWKPTGTILKLAESSDPMIAATATRLLGVMQDPRATDLLLKYLAEPGQRDEKAIITALGHTKDPRAVEPLLSIAKDPEKRKGKQAELGEALAELGDQRAAESIAELIRKADNRTTWDRLRAAYRKLTGKEYGAK